MFGDGVHTISFGQFYPSLQIIDLAGWKPTERSCRYLAKHFRQLLKSPLLCGACEILTSWELEQLSSPCFSWAADMDGLSYWNSISTLHIKSMEKNLLAVATLGPQREPFYQPSLSRKIQMSNSASVCKPRWSKVVKVSLQWIYQLYDSCAVVSHSISMQGIWQIRGTTVQTSQIRRRFHWEQLVNMGKNSHTHSTV